ncbi:MAG: endonuclease III [Thermoproteales archaeon]|nr:endonuclease III [Thermoproteales archaeon]
MGFLDQVLTRLKESMNIDEEDFIARKIYLETRDPFKTLVAAILSQNTRESNAFKAYERLEKMVGVDPEKIYEAEYSILEEAIRPAGLSLMKSRAIKFLAWRARKKGWFENLMSSNNIEDIRKKLTSVPGIGIKTADVLLVNLGFPVVPIDTHVRRVIRRLGIVDDGEKNYIRMQKKILENISLDNCLDLHFYLIKLGRTYCRDSKPLCDRCPLNDLCPSRNSEDSGRQVA